MTHPPDVVGKYAPDAIIGVIGNGKAKRPSLLPPIRAIRLRIWRLGGDWRMESFDDTTGVQWGERSIVREYLLLFESQHHL